MTPNQLMDAIRQSTPDDAFWTILVLFESDDVLDAINAMNKRHRDRVVAAANGFTECLNEWHE